MAGEATGDGGPMITIAQAVANLTANPDRRCFSTPALCWTSSGRRFAT
jgi:hypothetical protein